MTLFSVSLSHSLVATAVASHIEGYVYVSLIASQGGRIHAETEFSS